MNPSASKRTPPRRSPTNAVVLTRPPLLCFDLWWNGETNPIKKVVKREGRLEIVDRHKGRLAEGNPSLDLRTSHCTRTHVHTSYDHVLEYSPGKNTPPSFSFSLPEHNCHILFESPAAVLIHVSSGKFPTLTNLSSAKIVRIFVCRYRWPA